MVAAAFEVLAGFDREEPLELAGSQFALAVASKISFSPVNIQTANEYLVKPFARGKAYSFPLQDPIKNVICSPE
ncbi:MAG: hypothetical protein EOO89_02740 [Pedobacter sp.]|nr:MAG: hypothetical protein EOO89_02740 [Pedobacter sp.]